MRLTSVMLIIASSVTSLFAQNPNSPINRTFQYSELGLNGSVVTYHKEELYNQTVSWIKETYKNPELVLTMKIENEKVRIDAIASGLLKVRGFASNLNYIVEVSFKDNKYKFDVVSLLYDNNTDYKNIPNFKTDNKMIKNFGTTSADIEKYFNGMNESLRASVTGQSKKDDW